MLPEESAGEQLIPIEASIRPGFLQTHIPKATSVFSAKLSDTSGTSRAASEHLTPSSDITAAFEEISRLKQENQLLRQCLSVYNPNLSQASEERASNYAKGQEVSTVVCYFSFS